MIFFSKPTVFIRCRHFPRVILTLFFVISFSIGCFAQQDEHTKDPVKIFYQGQEAHAKGDYQTAVRLYDEALKISPDFPEAEYQRGSALLSLGKTTDAEKGFRRALELRPDWTLPMTSLGALLVQKNNFPEAEKLLMRAAEADEQNFLAFSALTDLRLKTKADVSVLKELLDKIKILTSKANPTASIWVSRAALENALKDKTAAKISLEHAFAIEPENKSAMIERAEIALDEGDIESARKYSEAVFRIAPDFSGIKILRARVSAADGNFEEAVKVLNSIPNPSADVLILRDEILANSSVDAPELEKLLEKDEKNAVVLGRLCAILRKNEPLKALEYCRRASEAEPNNINHAVGYGAALVQAKQYENAAALFRKLLQIAPDNYTARANLATALFQLKSYQDAKTEFLWLSQKQPDLPVTYFFLGISHDNLGEYADAMANYQQFLRLADPAQNQLEIDKVNLRLPALQKLIKQNKGKTGRKNNE